MCNKTDKEKVNYVLAKIDWCLSQYPDWADDPEQDRYYAVGSVLSKSQMNLVKDELLCMTY